MWSLFPQTSSSNLNNNVYTPPRLLPGRPRDSGARERWWEQKCSSGGGGRGGVRSAPGSLAAPSPPQLPRSRSRRRPGGAQPREAGAGQGDGRGFGPSLPPAPRVASWPAHPSLGAPGPPAHGPAPPRRRPALPRVRSSGTFSSPLSFRPVRNRHTSPG